MKNKIKYIIISAILILNPLFAQEKTETREVDYKQAFMQLMYDKAVKYSEKGEMAVEKTVDLAIEEAPKLAEEYIKWKIISHLVDGLPYIIMFFGSFLTIGFLITVRQKRVFQDNDFYPEHIFLIISSICVIFGAAGTFLGSPHLNGTSGIEDIKLATQAYVSPRIYIIEQFSDYVKEISKK